MIDEGTAS